MLCDLGQEALPLWTSVSSAVKLRTPAVASYHVVGPRVCLNLFLISKCVPAGHKVFLPFPPNSFFLTPGRGSCLIVHAALCLLEKELQLQGQPSSVVQRRKKQKLGKAWEVSTVN